eukprot:8543350-Ditylum_brightwellii.AAC.1
MRQKAKAKVSSALSAALSVASSAAAANDGNGDGPVRQSKKIKKLNPPPLPEAKPKDATSSTEAKEFPPLAPPG